jgi:hypothetical protein
MITNHHIVPKKYYSFAVQKSFFSCISFVKDCKMESEARNSAKISLKGEIKWQRKRKQRKKPKRK